MLFYENKVFHRDFFEYYIESGPVLRLGPGLWCSALTRTTIRLDPVVVRACRVASVALLRRAVCTLLPRLLTLVASALEVGLLATATCEHVQDGRVAPLAGAEQAMCHLFSLSGGACRTGMNRDFLRKPAHERELNVIITYIINLINYNRIKVGYGTVSLAKTPKTP